jgi:hypothetical protein
MLLHPWSSTKNVHAPSKLQNEIHDPLERLDQGPFIVSFSPPFVFMDACTSSILSTSFFFLDNVCHCFVVALETRNCPSEAMLKK